MKRVKRLAVWCTHLMIALNWLRRLKIRNDYFNSG
jgi:hypothetical protein